jgi:hypothetical protein
MRYTYKEFLGFCHQQNDKIQLDDDIVWHGKIPVPESLVKKIFFGSENLLGKYLDHLISAYAVQTYDLLNNTNFLSKVPTSSAVRDSASTLVQVLGAARGNENFCLLEGQIIQASGLKNYQRLNTERFLETLQHTGKKYERIYVPRKVKDFVTNIAPRLNTGVGISNGDMFGNVIADELQIYRSGFSDAFAGIFKEYLKFKFQHFGSLDPSLSALGLVQELAYKNAGSVILSKHLTRNLWEPRLGQNGEIKAYVNDSHPVFLNKDISKDEIFNLFLLAVSHEEMHTMNDQAKETIENFRQRVSSTLKDFIVSKAT